MAGSGDPKQVSAVFAPVYQILQDQDAEPWDLQRRITGVAQLP